MVGPRLELLQAVLGLGGLGIEQQHAEAGLARDLQSVGAGMRLGRPAQGHCARLELGRLDSRAGKDAAKALAVAPRTLAGTCRVDRRHPPAVDAAGQIDPGLRTGERQHLLVVRRRSRIGPGKYLQPVVPGQVRLGPAKGRPGIDQHRIGRGVEQQRRLRSGPDLQRALDREALQTIRVNGPHPQHIAAVGDVERPGPRLRCHLVRDDNVEARIGRDLGPVADGARDRWQGRVQRQALQARRQSGQVRCGKQPDRRAGRPPGLGDAAGPADCGGLAGAIGDGHCTLEHFGPGLLRVGSDAEFGTANCSHGRWRADLEPAGGSVLGPDHVFQRASQQVQLHQAAPGEDPLLGSHQPHLGQLAHQHPRAVLELDLGGGLCAVAQHRAHRNQVTHRCRSRNPGIRHDPDVAVDRHQARAQRLQLEPLGRNSQAASRPHPVRVRNPVELGQAQRIGRVLQETLADIPGVVTGSHRIDELVCRLRQAAAEDQTPKYQCAQRLSPLNMRYCPGGVSPKHALAGSG